MSKVCTLHETISGEYVLIHTPTDARPSSAQDPGSPAATFHLRSALLSKNYKQTDLSAERAHCRQNTHVSRSVEEECAEWRQMTPQSCRTNNQTKRCSPTFLPAVRTLVSFVLSRRCTHAKPRCPPILDSVMTLALAPGIKQLRTLASVAAVVVAVVTLVSCVLSTKLGGRYTGGLAWPYLSDLVRDAPAYYAFAFSALVVAVLLSLSWGFNYEFQCAVLLEPNGDAGAAPSIQFQLPTAATHLLRTNVALGTVSMLGLVVLALFSASSFPATHSVATHWFLGLLSVAVFLNVRSLEVNTWLGWLVLTIRSARLCRRSSATRCRSSCGLERTL